MSDTRATECCSTRSQLSTRWTATRLTTRTTLAASTTPTISKSSSDCDLLQLQEASVDPAFFRRVADLVVLLPQELRFTDHVDLRAVGDGAGHRGSAGQDAARTAPELDTGANAGRGHAEIACRHSASSCGGACWSLAGARRLAYQPLGHDNGFHQ